MLARIFCKFNEGEHFLRRSGLLKGWRQRKGAGAGHEVCRFLTAGEDKAGQKVGSIIGLGYEFGISYSPSAAARLVLSLWR